MARRAPLPARSCGSGRARPSPPRPTPRPRTHRPPPPHQTAPARHGPCRSHARTSNLCREMVPASHERWLAALYARLAAAASAARGHLRPASRRLHPRTHRPPPPHPTAPARHGLCRSHAHLQPLSRGGHRVARATARRAACPARSGGFGRARPPPSRPTPPPSTRAPTASTPTAHSQSASAAENK